MIANPPPASHAAQVHRVQAPTLLWAVRRALIGIAILTVVVSAAAWLLYASLDQEAEASADPSASAAISTKISDKRGY